MTWYKSCSWECKSKEFIRSPGLDYISDLLWPSLIFEFITFPDKLVVSWRFLERLDYKSSWYRCAREVIAKIQHVLWDVVEITFLMI